MSRSRLPVPRYADEPDGDIGLHQRPRAGRTLGELPTAVPVFGRMKTPPRKKDKAAQVGKRRTGAPESPQSNETFARRTQPPGEVGLANETRPGLGTRADEPFPGEPGEEPKHHDKLPPEHSVAEHQHSSVEPNDKPLPREPREQLPDSWAHEAERSTGVSGHMGGS